MSKHQKKRQNTQNTTANQKPKKPWYKSVRNIIIIVVLAAVLGTGGWSIYYFPSRPYNKAAIQVNNSTLNMRYFINTLKLYYGKAPSDTAIADFADYVEQQIEQSQKIILGSKALGVEIPRSDIVKELAGSAEKTTAETIDLTMAQDLMKKQVPDNQPQYNVQAMLLESETAAQTAIARLQAGDNFTAVSANLSKFAVSNTDPATLGWVTSRQADISLSSTKFGSIIASAGNDTISGPAYDDSVTKQYGFWVAEMVDTGYQTDNVTPQIHVYGILVATEQAAKDVLNKLYAGADMNTLAKESSLLPSANTNGADLGWITAGEDPNLFGALYTGLLNNPIGPIGDSLMQTAGGYWVYKITDKNDSMALTNDQKTTLQNDFLSQCTAALSKNPKYNIKSLLTQDMKDFALNKVVDSQGKGSVLIATNKLPIGEAGVEYYCKLQLYGQQKGNTWSITDGSLPEGLSFDVSKGVISGVPKFGGGGGFTVKAENSVHYSTQQYSIQIYVPIAISTTSLPDGQVGTAYSQIIDAFSDVQYDTWTVLNGSLPDGLTLGKSTGTVSGTPTKAGTFSFTVQADDGIGKTTQDLTITIN